MWGLRRKMWHSRSSLLGASLTKQVIGFQGRQAWVGEAEILRDHWRQQADLSPKGKDRQPHWEAPWGRFPSSGLPQPQAVPLGLSSAPGPWAPGSQPRCYFSRFLLLFLALRVDGVSASLRPLLRSFLCTDPS